MKIRLTFVAFLAASSAAFAIAQVPANAPGDSAGQMTLHVTVDSRAGTPVEGLSASDFTLQDNKKQEPITSIREVKGQATDTVIVLDAINLPYTQLSYARQQLSRFLSANGGKLAEPTTIGVLLSKGIQLQPNFTTDGSVLSASLDKFDIGLREITRAAGVYGDEEQMRLSLSMMKALIAQLPQEGPKRIIWVSPGWPLLGGPQIQLNPSTRSAIFTNVIQLATELRKLDIVVDVVDPLGASQDIAAADYYQTFLRAPRNTNDVVLGNLGLQVLAVNSGGVVLTGSNDIVSLLQEAVQQAQDYYVLSFVPAPGERDNEYHELRLKVKGSGLSPHTTTGYYARPLYPPLERSQLTPSN